MKIVLIGPGGTSIPPNGWGAVESIVWDYYQELSKKGHSVIIMNEPNLSFMISKTNAENPDLVYIMYDDHIVAAPHIRCSHIFYMSHYAYITQPNFEEKQKWYFNNIFKKVIENQSFITLNAISSEILSVYTKYGYTGKANIIHNGARSDLFNYLEKPDFPNKSIYIGKIENRKAQYRYQQIPDLYFAGNYHSSSFNTNNPNYLGEWTKPKLYENLTKYSNLILLSDGEADPLVVKEALVAGLGVVVSKCSSANLDITKPFVTVIPDDKLHDITFVKEAIVLNREISVNMREQIREYGLTEFAWTPIIDKFLEKSSIRKCLKIALIGPGIMPIPPPGWGAVEILIWDYYKELTRIGHKVDIINTPTQTEIIKKVNEGQYDFVHLHYDVFWRILDYLKCPKIAITSHYPYIDQIDKHANDGYSQIFAFLTNQRKYMNFVLAEKDYQTFLKNGATNLHRMKNGVDSSAFKFSENVKIDKAIYLGKINKRKKQAKYQCLSDIDFVGGCDDYLFDTTRQNYLGEWTRDQIHEHLTDYGNLVLLSEGEADPLVVKEALIAGLPIVTNRSSMNELNIRLPFIDIIPDNKLDDMEYIEKVIVENRKKQIYKRQIREYAVREFSWEGLVKNYINAIICI